MPTISISGNNSTKIHVSEGSSLYDALRGAALLSAPCGGNGKCGKCRVTLAGSGRSVLACQTPVLGDMTVILPQNAQAEVMTQSAVPRSFTPGEGLGAAVDLGTTTVAVKLFDLSSGRELGVLGEWNAQRAFGADVISRIKYIMDEPQTGLERLKGLIEDEICALIAALCREAGADETRLSEIFIAGNTVMEHIAAGLSPVSIATAPFCPLTRFETADRFAFSRFPAAKVSFAPCVSGYVGGDIVCGLLSKEADFSSRSALFLDIGTNGELVLRHNGRFYACSVACGPAFEGAEIACGMAGVAGAISGAWLDGRELSLTVIGEGEPRGICGSGLLDLAACLIELGVIDGGGRLLPPEEVGDFPFLDEDEDENGICYLSADRSVYLCAGDVRRLQLAKAAVAAGIEVLLSKADIREQDIEKIYLAGGFGGRLNAESAARIGMIPAGLAHSVEVIGNASLSGASMALLSPDARARLYPLAKDCGYTELSGEPLFTKAFTDCIMFQESEDLL